MKGNVSVLVTQKKIIYIGLTLNGCLNNNKKECNW